MPEILKGNYELPESTRPQASEAVGKTLTDEFEEATLAQVGGSICFVMKTDTFVWRGDEQADGRSSS